MVELRSAAETSFRCNDLTIQRFNGSLKQIYDGVLNKPLIKGETKLPTVRSRMERAK